MTMQVGNSTTMTLARSTKLLNFSKLKYLVDDGEKTFGFHVFVILDKTF